jgi:hypothetical protein
VAATAVAGAARDGAAAPWLGLARAPCAVAGSCPRAGPRGQGTLVGRGSRVVGVAPAQAKVVSVGLCPRAPWPGLAGVRAARPGLTRVGARLPTCGMHRSTPTRARSPGLVRPGRGSRVVRVCPPTPERTSPRAQLPVRAMVACGCGWPTRVVTTGPLA